MIDPTCNLLPEGLEDRLPPDASALARIERGMLEVMDAHGYDFVRPPLIEFEKSMAMRMEGVQPRRMFRFVDPRSLRTLALRSDITVQVGRIAATGLASAPRPLRLCYSGPVVRITGDTLDPRRESLQIGAELIGSDSVAAAAEIVSVAVEALSRAGATRISVDFTLPDLVDTLAAEALPLAPEQIEDVRRELDGKDVGGLKAVGGEAYLPLLYATGPFEDAIRRLSEVGAGGALDSRIEGLQQIAARIGDGVRLTLDPTERHGFEYQSWFGFMLYAEGVRGALGRGGTYHIRGADEPATGFSLFPDPLVEAMTVSESRPSVFLPLGHDVAAAAALRGKGWRTVAALSEREYPAELGCTHCLQDAQAVKL
ncbi:ATP phosphoribosyltransferase regulatory subunit [Altericroceibacterium xinjiangense]|uniref:ATP phosphoribosyltransferase regulatory subunit n=1 Tax=Altericroceibacterium xinjiangense TaxID=762261 RepID=UPI000F7DE7EC|nr:ATP phosphoribosyltransferase regulatory subunit [Altericroceibacterium xinjiangense]